MKTKDKPWMSKFQPWKKATLYDEDIFFDDLLRVRIFYREEGFWQARVKDHELIFNDKQGEVNIIIHVEEREPLIVEQIGIDLAPETTKEMELDRLTKLLQLKSGKRYREQELIADHDIIIEWFSNRGYPYIKANVEEDIDHRQHVVSLTWQLRPGTFSRFGEIKFTGLEQIEQKVLERGLEFKSGDPFSQKKLDDSRGQLYRSGLFQFVKIGSGQQETQFSEIPVEVQVKEISDAKLAFGIGYSTEGAFRVFSGLEQLYFLGEGRLLKALVLHSTNLIPLLVSLELNQPFFLSARNNLKLRSAFIWKDEKAFESKRFISEATLSREISEAVSAFLTAEFSRADVESKSEIIEESGINKILKLRTGLTWNTSDQVFNPTRGFYSSIYVEEAGRIRGAETKYFQLFAEHRRYFSIFEDNVLAIRLSAGSIKPQGDGVIPIEERLFSGGTFSVRGWRRQLLGPSIIGVNGDVVPLGGNSQIEGSIEFRRPLVGNIASAFFVDYGNVWLDWDGFDLLDLRYAIGVGLRYNTIIGPLRLDFAWKVNKQELDTRNYEIHFSLGQAF